MRILLKHNDIKIKIKLFNKNFEIILQFFKLSRLNQDGSKFHQNQFEWARKEEVRVKLDQKKRRNTFRKLKDIYYDDHFFWGIVEQL